MEVTGGVTGTRTGNFKFNIIGILDQKKNQQCVSQAIL